MKRRYLIDAVGNVEPFLKVLSKLDMIDYFEDWLDAYFDDDEFNARMKKFE